MVLTFESVDEIPKCDHSSESYCAVVSCAAVYHNVQGGFNLLMPWVKSKRLTFKRQMKATQQCCCLLFWGVFWVVKVNQVPESLLNKRVGICANAQNRHQTFLQGI